MRKASSRDLAAAITLKQTAATTVAATMRLADRAGIRVFATGGIGGVHRGAAQTWDVSADLTELAHTPVAVVCAGAKSIVDLPATLECLETQSGAGDRLRHQRVPGVHRPFERPAAGGAS